MPDLRFGMDIICSPDCLKLNISQSSDMVKNGLIKSVPKNLTSVLNLESWEDLDLGPKS